MHNGRPAVAHVAVDLGAIRANWRALAQASAPAECGAVVKADAYGLGAAAICAALSAEGCRTFFVATLAEAEALRLPAAATLYVFNGLQAEAGGGYDAALGRYRRCGARPVLNAPGEIAAWSAVGAPAAIMLDTGMNRLGVPAAEAAAARAGATFPVTHVMSHLACADEPRHPLNTAQREAFATLAAAHFPGVPASLANSAGIALGPAHRFELTRPGIALYAGTHAACRVLAPVLQLRLGAAGETVGYGATRTLARATRIAIVAAGYADGYARGLGGSDAAPGATAYFGARPMPVLGRVSMDLLALDASASDARPGDMVELIGAGFTVHDAARLCGTLPYEVLTRLGPRLPRHYEGA